MPSPSPSLSDRRNVLIFRSELLRYSETFIPNQAETFQTFTPVYTGYKTIKGIQLPPARTVGPSAIRLIGRARNLMSLLGVFDPWFIRSIRQMNPELIHAHFEEDGMKALTLATQLKIPLFVTCHGYDVTVAAYRWHGRPFLGNHYQLRRKALFRRASLCLGVSRFICDQMLQRGYPKEKVRLHYIGVDTERFRPDPEISKQSTILFVGRLVEKKGCGDLMQAMRQVNAKYPEIKLNIIGDGPLKAELESYAQAEKINATFCGVQPPQVVQKFLKEALMFCMPSLRAKSGDSEGLGIVNLEAQAVGVPVIGTFHGGIPEAVKHGVTGLLAPERDPKTLAENILALLADSNLRSQMGVAARDRMVQHFDLKQQSALLEKYYMEFV